MESLILASASPRRQEIFRLAELDFEVMPSTVEEVITKKEPCHAVIELASQKAMDVFLQTDKSKTVVGADTIVAMDGKILGKPKDEEDAKNMLHLISGKIHEVYTGVAVIGKQYQTTFYEETKVSFYPLTEEEIDAYIKTKEPMDKAGAYGIQGKAAVFIEGIQGNYYNVVGFPIARFMQEMKSL